MKSIITEFIGTFFLVLVIFLAVGGGAGSFAPLAIGSVLIAMIYAGFHISGAHYNPAVTVAACLRGAFSWSDAPGYIVAQFLAAVAGTYSGIYLLGHFPNGPGIINHGSFDFAGGTLAEFLGTFALVWVILQVATVKRTAGNSYYGLAIGLTVIACIYAFGDISGAALNPAVALGAVVGGMTEASNMGAFLVGQLVAAVAAAYLFKYVNGEE